MTAACNSTQWYEGETLCLEQRQQLARAQQSLRRDEKPIEPCRMIAQLSFGFWTGLFGPKYADLWRDQLFEVFPKRALQRSEAHERLDSVRKLRNRIAHHEPILSRPLEKDFNQILDTIAWICPVTARWVGAHSALQVRFAGVPHMSLSFC